jgi:hypothetical protein
MNDGYDKHCFRQPQRGLVGCKVYFQLTVPKIAFIIPFNYVLD